MYIYLDESGSFVTPSTPHKISAVAALVIPESQHDALIGEFERLERSWRGATEPKGSQLGETQIGAVIAMLSPYDVLFDVTAIDMALQRDSDTSEVKTEQAARVVKHVDSETPPTLAAELRTLSAAILDISNQLFIQAFLTILLVERILNTATLFYVLRNPHELGRFIWVVDAKDVGGSKYERLWRTLVLPLVQSRSAKEPFATLQGADYSYFARFFVNKASFPEHLKPYSSGSGGADFALIMNENFTLGQSQAHPGLRMVDILAAAFTRAVNARLAPSGWDGLGRLMVTRSPRTIEISRLKVGGVPLSLAGVPYVDVVNQLEAQTKSMFP